MGFRRRVHLACLCVTGAAFIAVVDATGDVPFTLQGPGVNPGDFRVTTFASGLSFPLGMVELSDGSLLVTVVQNSSFFSGSLPGKLVRFTDTDGNGIADDAGTVLYSNLPPALTSLRIAGDLILVRVHLTPFKFCERGGHLRLL